MTPTRLLARPLLASMFVVGGVNAFRNADSMATKAARVTDRVVPFVQRTVPAAPIPTDPRTLVRANAAVHLLAAAGLATGRAPRLSATVLAASLVPTTLAGHPYWTETDPATRANQRIHFWKNVSMLGGLILAGVDTEGRPGLAWRAGHAARAARRDSRRLARAARREAKLAAAQLR